MGNQEEEKNKIRFVVNQTKVTQVSQYEQMLHKDSNWEIVN